MDVMLLDWKSADSGSTSGPPQLGERDVHLWLFDLNAAGEDYDAALDSLAADEHDRAQRFHFERDRRRFVAGRGQLRRLLGAYTETAADRIGFNYGPAGKPTLASAGRAGADLAGSSAAAGLEFNLSHCEQWALLGVTRGRRIGVDIEIARPIPDYDDVARHHFSAAELAALRSLPEGQRNDAFHACWTRKEAYVKAIGDGLSAPLDKFEVSLDPDAPAAFHSIDGSIDAARAWTLWGGKILADAWAAIAVDGRDLNLVGMKL